MKNKWDFFGVGLITLVGIWGIFGLWKIPGLPTSHDSISHMARLYAYLEGLKDGIFPVLWAKRLYFGLGSPVLMLNYQIPYYFAMIWKFLGMNLDDSYKAALSFSYVLSGIFMYRALRIRYKPLAAMSGAILYLVVPYRYLNIYVRGALGEVFSSMFPPLILAGIWKQSVALKSIGWAGLFLSHPVGSAIYSAIFLGYVLFENKFKNLLLILKNFFIPYGLALLIASFNLLPTLALTKYTYYSAINGHTLEHFPTIKQLIYSRWGYGFSSVDSQDAMSFQVGVAQWIVAAVALVFIFFNMLKGFELKYYIIIFFASILLMIKPIATPIYHYFYLDKILDFPWRLLMIFPFICAMIGTLILSNIKNLKFQILFLIFIGIVSLYTNRNHLQINAIWPWPSIKFATETGDAFGEYASRWRETKVGLESASTVQIVDGVGVLKVTKDSSNKTIVETSSDSKLLIRFNTMYFPGWRAYINEKEILMDSMPKHPDLTRPCFVTSRVSQSIDDSGLISCNLPPGNNQVMIRYNSLPIHIIGNSLSILGIIILIYFASLPFSSISNIPTKRPKS